MRNYARIVPLAALFLVSMIVGLPLLSGRVLAGHDIVNYLIHAQQTAENLRQGLLFPSWAGGYVSGFGSPVLLFFPPVTSYLGALTVLAGVPVILGTGWLALVALFCSGLAAFGWLRSSGFEGSALPAAMVYIIAPYRLVDLYLRSALAEHWAFVWPPLILWIVGSGALPPSARVALMALAVAGLVLTHVPSAVLFGIGLTMWFVVSVAIRGRRLQIASGVVLGLCLSLFSLVPLVLASTLLDLEGCFGSASGKFRPSSNTLFVHGLVEVSRSVMSWSVVATFLLALAAWMLLGKTGRTSKSAAWAMAATVASLAATTAPAGPLWEATPILANLQFPWRITSVMTLTAVALIARLHSRQAWIVAALASALAVPFSSWDRTLPQRAFLPEKPALRSQPGTVFPDPHTAWEAGSGGWYWRHHHLAELCLLPRSMPRSLLREMAGSPVPAFDAIRGRSAVVLDDPTAPIDVVQWGQTRRIITVDSSVGGTLMWRVLWFPTMRVSVDGHDVPVRVDSATGLVTHRVDPGVHRVECRWHPFPGLRAARHLSAWAFFATALLGVAAALGRRENPGRF